MDRDELKPDTAPGEESFLARWSRRKRQPDAEPEDPHPPGPEEAQGPDGEAPPPPTDEDMPPIESLGDDDDYSGFLSPGVSEALRRQALKRLFFSPKFNVTDGLDDYAEDFTKFAPLGDVVTADMKYQMERMLARLEEEAGEDDGEPAGQAVSDISTIEEDSDPGPDPRPDTEPTNDSEEPSPT